MHRGGITPVAPFAAATALIVVLTAGCARTPVAVFELGVTVSAGAAIKDCEDETLQQCL